MARKKTFKELLRVEDATPDGEKIDDLDEKGSGRATCFVHDPHELREGPVQAIMPNTQEWPKGDLARMPLTSTDRSRATRAQSAHTKASTSGVTSPFSLARQGTIAGTGSMRVYGEAYSSG